LGHCIIILMEPVATIIKMRGIFKGSKDREEIYSVFSVNRRAVWESATRVRDTGSAFPSSHNSCSSWRRPHLPQVLCSIPPGA
jgi:hypothetical protein